MATVAFDTLRFTKRMKDAGVPERQAEAEAEALAEIFAVNLKDLASRDDLKALEERLSTKIAATEERLSDKITMLEQRMIIKLGGMMVAAVAIVATLVKLL